MHQYVVTLRILKEFYHNVFHHFGFVENDISLTISSLILAFFRAILALLGGLFMFTFFKNVFCLRLQVPFLQSTINEITQADNEQALTGVLEKFDSPYHFERPEERNLINWYKVLNRFDELLERYVNERSIFGKSSVVDYAKQNSAASSSASTPRPSPSFALPVQSSPSLTLRDSQDDITIVVDPQPPNVSTVALDVSEVISPSRVFMPSQKLVLLILRLTQRIIRNSSHDTRHVYNSVEHIGALLSDDSTAIVLLALEIINMLLQRSHKFRSARIAMTTELIDRLYDLSIGWGGRENGLGLLECCSATQSQDLSDEGKKLFFEYTAVSRGSEDSDTESESKLNMVPDTPSYRLFNSVSSGRAISASPLPLPPSIPFVPNSTGEVPSVKSNGKAKTIYMLDAGLFQGDERWLLTDFAQKHGVPKNKLFSLLCAFRRAKRFSQGRDSRIEACVIRLYAITTLFQVHPLPNSLNESLGREPELVQDVVSLAKSESVDGVHDIPVCLRIVAIRCITAMSSDRHRVSGIVAATGVDQHHGALPTLLRNEMTSLLSSSNSAGLVVRETSESDAMTEDTESLSSTLISAGSSSNYSSLSLLAECSPKLNALHRILTTEALLILVHSLALASGSSGATPLANSGVLAILIPSLSDCDPKHSRVVAQALRTMQAIIEGSNQSVGCQLFRDQNGLALVSERIALEVGVEFLGNENEQSANDEAVEVEALRRRGESRALYQRLASQQMTPHEALENQPPSASAASRGLLAHSKWALLRALHQLLLISLGSGGNEVREVVAHSRLPLAMRKILSQPFMHGGSLFYSAASVTTDIAHAEPTATAELVKAGIAQAVLKAVNVGLPPCGEAIRCVPSLLAALCLAPSAREVIVSSSPLKPYLLRLATPFYTRAMHGEIPLYIGNSLDELMRHVEALRPEGNRAMCEYLNMSASFIANDVGNLGRLSRRHSASSTRSGDQDYPRVDRKSKSGDSNTVQPGGPQVEGESTHPDIVLLDKMKLAVANNSCRLAGFHQGSSEHQEGIVASGALKFIIDLRLAPALACPEASVRDTHTFSRHYPTPAVATTSLVTSLRNFSSRHGTTVLKSLFKVVLQDASYVLQIAKDLDDLWLPEEEVSKIQETMADSSESHNQNIVKKERNQVNSEERSKLRNKLEESIRKLRTEVSLLNGLSRGGPGSSSGAWENAGGSHVATIISTVERAVRSHLAKVYTGLSLSAIADGDLITARVTAAADPVLKPLRSDQVTRSLGDISKLIWNSRSKNKRFEEICKSYQVPPEELNVVRRDVKGLAWHMVTFAVAAQRLYSTLSKGLMISSRRHSRDPVRFGANARSLAATIGRIFALHFKAAIPLWNCKVITMGHGTVDSAWDYVRGIIVEVKGTLFDEPRSVTQRLLLKAFLEAGGGEALIDAVRPSILLRGASPRNSVLSLSSSKDSIDIGDLQELLDKETLITSSLVLALGDLVRESEEGVDGRLNLRKDIKSEDEASSDSIAKQARAMSRMAVSDVDSRKLQTLSPSDRKFMELLRDSSYLCALKEQTKELSKLVMDYSSESLIRKIAADSWSTVGAFLHLLSSCPSSSNNPHTPDLPLSNDDWAPHDIHRSALNVVLRLLEPVTEHAEDLMSVRTADSTALTDILGIVQATSSNFQDLCRKPAGSENNIGNIDDWEDFLEPQEETPSSRPASPDPELVQSLVEMGFSERRARMALRYTPGGIQFATEWLLSSQEAGIVSDRSDDEDRQWTVERQNRGSSESGAVEDGDNDVDDDDDDDDEGDDDNDEDDDNVVDEENEDAEVEDEVDVDEEPNEEEEVEVDVGDDSSIQDEESAMDHDSENVSRDDVMIDTADGESSPVDIEGEVGLQSEEAAPTGQDGIGNPLAESETVQAGRRRIELSPTKTNVSSKTVPRSAETDVQYLLFLSARTELWHLHCALKERQGISPKNIEALCDVAASQMGLPEAGKDLNENDKDIRVKPVSVEKFKMRKKWLFDGLVKFTLSIIRESDGKNLESHVPYVAVGLLSALYKDGAISKEKSEEFSARLTEGLNQLLASADNEPRERDFRGQFVSLWSHTGGCNARSWLEKSGLFRIAMEHLKRIIESWEQSDDCFNDASGPIEKLRISEADNDSIGVNKGISSLSSKETRELRSPTETEVVKLGQLTTCLLVLDAQVRYKRKDDFVDLAQKRYAESSSEKRRKQGKMDMDAEGTDRRDTETNGEQATDQRREPRNRRIEDDSSNVRGGGKGNVDVVMKTSENELNTDKEKEEAAQKREEVLTATLSIISKLVTPADVDMDVIRKNRVELLNHALSSLRIMKKLESGDALMAVLQLLGSLTQEWHVAEAAFKCGIVDMLLGLPHLEQRRVASVDCRVVRMLVRTILRQVMEDQDTLKEAMVSEIRDLATGTNRSPRSPHSLRSLIEATTPLAARDIQAYVCALQQCVSSSGSDRLSRVVVTNQRGMSRNEAEERLRNRQNVKKVISGLCGLLAINSADEEDRRKTERKVKDNTSQNSVYELPKYALKTLSELAELSRVAAVAMITTVSPSNEVEGSALDYMVQKLLPLSIKMESKTGTVDMNLVNEGHDLCNGVQRVFLALCSKGAGAHNEAVEAFARAVAIEASRERACSGIIKGVAQCLGPGTRSRVMRAVLKTSLANDLATCLSKLDLGGETGLDVSMCVLRALSLIGEAATHMARHGDQVGDDVSFGGRGGEAWMTLRDTREDFVVI